MRSSDKEVAIGNDGEANPARTGCKDIVIKDENKMLKLKKITRVKLKQENQERRTRASLERNCASMNSDNEQNRPRYFEWQESQRANARKLVAGR